MANSLSKVRGKIAKKDKKHAIHENSRDAQNLRRATARAVKLEKLAVAQSKRSQALCKLNSLFGKRAAKIKVHRVEFFQAEVKHRKGVIGDEDVHMLIQRLVGSAYRGFLQTKFAFQLSRSRRQ